MSSIKKDTFTLQSILVTAADGTVLPLPTSCRLLSVHINAPGLSADVVATVKKNGSATTVTGTVVAATDKGSIVPTTTTALANAEIDASSLKGQYGSAITYSNGVSYGVSSGTNYIGGTFPSEQVLVDFVAGDTVAVALATATGMTAGAGVAVLTFEKI
jgi:hypothetical protein